MADEDWAAEVDEQERQISGQVSESLNQKCAKSCCHTGKQGVPITSINRGWQLTILG